MRVTQITTVLALGAGSLAFLIPSTTSLEGSSVEIEISEKIDSKLSPEAAAISALTQTLEIPCESCPFYTGKDSKGAATFSQTPNDLVLTLSLDPLARDVINLNGAPLFPFVYTQSEPEPIKVTQKAKDGQETTVPVGLDLIIETDEHNLSRLRLHILSVAGFATQATMEILEFPVFQNAEGEIFIGEVHKRPPTSAEASSVMCKGDVLCRWKHYLYDAFQRVTGTGKHSGPRKKGGCHGKGRHFKRPPHTVDSHEKPHHGKQHGGEQPHHHEHKWGFFGWAALIVRLVIACLLIAAITMSIGLFVTIFLSSVFHVALVAWWFITGKYRNLNVRDYQVVVNEEEDEEAGLMTKDEEAQLEVPAYSDELPTYAENQEKQ